MTLTGMRGCIFCLRPGAVSNSVAHVGSQSLFEDAPKLPLGWECDECNKKKLSKVERKFLNDSLISVLRVIEGGLTKKGKLPSVRWKRSSVQAVYDSNHRRTIQIRLPQRPSDLTAGGFTIDLPPEAPVVVSRFLCKLLVEGLVFFGSRYVYDRRLDAARRYAIEPCVGQFIPYAFRQTTAAVRGGFRKLWEEEDGPAPVVLLAFGVEFLTSGLPMPEAKAFVIEAENAGWSVRSSIRAPKRQSFRFNFRRPTLASQ